jgi:hypothetical protein
LKPLRGRRPRYPLRQPADYGSTILLGCVSTHRSVNPLSIRSTYQFSNGRSCPSRKPVLPGLLLLQVFSSRVRVGRVEYCRVDGLDSVVRRLGPEPHPHCKLYPSVGHPRENSIEGRPDNQRKGGFLHVSQ